MDSKSVTRDPYHQGHSDRKGSKVEPDVYSQSGTSFRKSAEEMIPLGKGFRSNSDLFSIANGHRRVEEESFNVPERTNYERSNRNNNSLFQPHNAWMMNTPSDQGYRQAQVFRSFMPVKNENSLMQSKTVRMQQDLEDIPHMTRDQKRIFSSTIVQPRVKFDQENNKPYQKENKNGKMQDSFSDDIEDNSKTRKKIHKSKETLKKPTKNLLRDFAKNVHQYILHSTRAHEQLLRLYTKHQPEEYKELSFLEMEVLFKKHVEKIRDERQMETFVSYRNKWMGQTTFDFYYRYLTMRFYLYESIGYFFKSKVTNKGLYVQYIHKFAEGLLTPHKFDRFSQY